jgi:hypothetical protein
MSKVSISALGVPLQIGELIASVQNSGGVTNSTKGVVIEIKEDNKVQILMVKGQFRYLWQESPIENEGRRVRLNTINGMSLIQVNPEIIKEDPDFKMIFESDRYKKIFKNKRE